MICKPPLVLARLGVAGGSGNSNKSERSVVVTGMGCIFIETMLFRIRLCLYLNKTHF